MNWEQRLKFMYWLLETGITLMVPSDLKTDGNKQPIMLKGDKYPQMSGHYQLSATGKSGLWDGSGKFHQLGNNTDMVKIDQFEKKLDMVQMVQVDIFG